MTKASDNVFPKLIGSEGAAPGTPASATAILYVKSDGLWYSKDDAGVETLVSSGAASGIPATILDAKGDLIAASAADTAARLAVGANDLVLTAASGEATGLKWAAALGVWTDFTPTITASGGGFVLGSSVVNGRYKLLDSKTGLVQMNLVVTTGGAWNPGTGNWEFSLPASWTTPNVANRTQLLACHVLDSGTTNFVCVAKVPANSTKITEINVGDGTSPRNLTNNAPVTWATGDAIDITGILELA